MTSQRQRSLLLLRAAAFTALAVLLISTSSARAACYETVGCTDKNAFQLRDLRKMSCEDLRRISSDIETENGFCWKVWTDANRSCKYTARAALPLSRVERVNLRAIDRALSLNAC
jgi:hypothetical protein